MDTRANAYLRHQQARWLRADAARWVRPDAAKFLKPGTRLSDVYPALARNRDTDRFRSDRAFADAIALERSVLTEFRRELIEVKAALARRRAEKKYNEDQPRVPRGNSDGGQWTSDGSSGRPRVHIYRTNPDSDEIGEGDSDVGNGIGIDFGTIDFGDIASEIDKLDLFDIKPHKPRSGGVRLAGEPPRRLPPIVVTREKPKTPGIGHNGGPPLEPPDIPSEMPTRETGMLFVRQAARWVARVGRRAPVVDIFFGALDQAESLKRLTDMIKTANDPPKTLETLHDRATLKSEDGYNDHHIVNQHDSNRKKFGQSRIDSRENLVRVPTLIHIEITRWYSTKHKNYGFRPPQEVLREKDWDEQMRVGIDVLRDFKVIK